MSTGRRLYCAMLNAILVWALSVSLTAPMWGAR